MFHIPVEYRFVDSTVQIETMIDSRGQAAFSGLAGFTPT